MNDYKDRISVIVPVYHAARTLRKCVNSILKQSYKNIECIIVIDGIDKEQQKCLSICDSFLKDNRLKVYPQENKGVDYARFTGLNISTGEYVTFVDSDDWLPKDAFAKMVKAINYHGGVDCVIASSYKRLGPFRKRRYLPATGAIYNPDLFSKYYISFLGWNIIPVSIWGKLYRREIIEKAKLSPSGFSMGEDLVFNLCLFPFISSAYFLDIPLYNYRYGGMTNRYNPYLLKDLKRQFLLKLEMIKKYNYHMADDPIRIEIVNVFHSDIKQKIINKELGENLILKIQKEINDPFWEDVFSLNNTLFRDTPFFKAMQSRDAEAVFDICAKEVHNERRNRLVKKVLSIFTI